MVSVPLEIVSASIGDETVADQGMFHRVLACPVHTIAPKLLLWHVRNGDQLTWWEWKASVHLADRLQH
jgi:hypothetical protein